MDQEIVKVEPQEIQVQVQSPVMQLAGQLAAGNISADQMEKMLDVQIKWEDNEAKKAYHLAMAKFQENVPSIIKTKDGHNCKYASLSNIVAAVAPKLSLNGLSHAWITESIDGGVKVTCKITHMQGYSESTSMFAAPDASGKKNAIQALGSTVTYLQRYTLKAALGIAEADQGDDGNGGPDKEPEFKEPVGSQKAGVATVQDMLLDSVPEGKTLNYGELCKLLVDRWGSYPSGEEQGKEAAKEIVKRNLINLVCEDKK